MVCPSPFIKYLPSASLKQGPVLRIDSATEMNKMEALPSRRRGGESHTRWWFLEDLDKCQVARADKGLLEFEWEEIYFQGLVEEGAFELALTKGSKD